MKNHTPTPWHLAGDSLIVEEHGISIAQMLNRGTETPSPRANAEFIVRACNSHDALLDACQEAIHCLIYEPKEDEGIRCFEKLKAAIKLAEEGV